MADNPPIDINKARKAEEKQEDIKLYLETLYRHVVDAHNHILLRTQDLERDAVELHAQVHVLLQELWEKYPELVPEIETEEKLDE